MLAALIAGMVSTAQNTVIHDPNAQVRSVDNFHALKVATGIHLYFTQGSERAVAVSAASAEYRDRIRTEVKDGVLHIYYENHWNWSFRDMMGKDLKVYVSSSLLDGLDASSGAEVEVEGTLKSANLALDFSSGARFSGKIAVENLQVDQSSGAHSTISGAATLLKAEASSGSALHGYDLTVGQCSVSASSGGHVELTVEKEMTASASSGGHVNYQGGALLRDVHTGSGGSVSRR